MPADDLSLWECFQEAAEPEDNNSLRRAWRRLSDYDWLLAELWREVSSASDNDPGERLAEAWQCLQCDDFCCNLQRLVESDPDLRRAGPIDWEHRLAIWRRLVAGAAAAWAADCQDASALAHWAGRAVAGDDSAIIQAQQTWLVDQQTGNGLSPDAQLPLAAQWLEGQFRALKDAGHEVGQAWDVCRQTSPLGDRRLGQRPPPGLPAGLSRRDKLKRAREQVS